MKLKNKELLEIATEVAKKAGQRLAKKSRSSLNLKKLQKHDIKLLEDEVTEKYIKKILIKQTGIPVLGEEDLVKPDFKSGKIWILDPIDGTVNYSRGIPIASVSIGLWDNQNPLIGVVYDFFNDIVYSGMVGYGAKRNGKKISVSNNLTKNQSILLTGKPVKSDLSETLLKKWFKFFKDFQKVRMIGSASISLCYVASGIADAYTEEHIQIWDVAAGLAIVSAAGGSISFNQTNQSEYSYFVKATNGKFKF